MRAALRNPILLFLSVAAACALSLIAVADDWDDAALYAGMAGVVAMLGLIGLVVELRRARAQVVAGREPDPVE